MHERQVTTHQALAGHLSRLAAAAAARPRASGAMQEHHGGGGGGRGVTGRRGVGARGRAAIAALPRRVFAHVEVRERERERELWKQGPPTGRWGAEGR